MCTFPLTALQIRRLLHRIPRTGPAECAANLANRSSSKVRREGFKGCGALTRLLYTRRRCEEMLSKAFAQHSGQNEHVLLRSEQLVGTAIFVFARKGLLPHIARIEGASRKVRTVGRGSGLSLELTQNAL
jgi:hypothetical protein